MKKLLLSLLVLTLNLFAVPAYPGELSFKQNDGTTFPGHLKGDEWLHYISLENDYVAIYNKENKSYEYAVIKNIDGKNVLKPSGVLVDVNLHKNNPQELAKRIQALSSDDISSLYRIVPEHNKHKREHSTTQKKVIQTKSSQWKEILKEETPSKQTEHKD